jgi:hypothetical protein
MGHLKVDKIDDFMRNKVEMTYPAIIVDGVGEELALVVSCLTEGDIPIIVKHKGKTIMLDKRIDKSALNVSKLLKVYPFVLSLSESNSIEITNVEQYMEAFLWTH